MTIPYPLQAPTYDIRIYHPQKAEFDLLRGMFGDQEPSYISIRIINRFKLTTDPPKNHAQERTIRLNWIKQGDQETKNSKSTRFRVVAKEQLTHDIVIGKGFESHDDSDIENDQEKQQDLENPDYEETALYYNVNELGCDEICEGQVYCEYDGFDDDEPNYPSGNITEPFIYRFINAYQDPIGYNDTDEYYGTDERHFGSSRGRIQQNIIRSIEQQTSGELRRTYPFEDALTVAKGGKLRQEVTTTRRTTSRIRSLRQVSS